MDRPVLLGKLCVTVALAAGHVALAGTSGGCASSRPKADDAATAALTARPGGSSSLPPSATAQVLGADFGNQADDGDDPARSPEGANRARLRVVQLEIYRLVVPHGDISRS